MIMGTLLALLGLSGGGLALGLLAGAGFLTFLPGVVTRALTGFVQVVFEAAGWLLTSVLVGLQIICRDWRALLALAAVSLFFGWYADRYDPVRKHVPEWAQSAPSPVQKAQRARTAPSRPAPVKRDVSPMDNIFQWSF